MLHLSARAARRVGSSYVCAKCLAANNPALIPTTPAAHRAALIPHHDRPFSTTSPRATAAENQPSPAADPPDVVTPPPEPQASPPASAPSDSAAAPSPSQPKKKKKKSKKSAEAKKQDEAQPDAARQLHVLEGALAALRNVLAAQNINVENIKPAANNKKADKPEGPGKNPESGAKIKIKNAKGTKPLGKKELSKLQQALVDANAIVSQTTAGDHKTATSAKTATTETTADTASSKATAVDSEQSPPKTKEAKKAKPAAKPADKQADKQADKPAEKQAKTNQTKTNRERRAERRALALRAGPTPSDPPKPTDNKTQTQQSTLKKAPYNSIGGKVIGRPFSGEPYPEELRNPAESNQSKQPKKKQKQKEDTPALAISKINADDFQLIPIDAARADVPSLSYGLERVLFNPGVCYLQDPRSRVYNFDPYLSKIMPLQEFDFNALKQYVTSSKDTNLISITREHGKKYTGSTSSMSSMLSHFHYLISAWRSINISMLSKSITPDSLQFTRINRAPAAIFLNWKDGAYAIDADKEFDTANILSMLGKSMEKLLTLSKEDFERYRHANSDQITEEERNADEAFHYTAFEDFMLRSQLDAHDHRVPGTGMFDLKTRAVISIRMDAKGFEKGLGYEIRERFGQWQSFEREYYDMMRSAFMKYSLQVRMGRMDGIFVAFHNTERIFGFQYIPLSEMDLSLHGTTDTTIGNREFKFSLSLLNKILNRATEKYPETSLRLHFETRTSVGSPFMYIFAKPITQKDIDEVQNASKASIDAFEARVMGINKEPQSIEPAEAAEAAETAEAAESAENAETGDAADAAEAANPTEAIEPAETTEQAESAADHDQAVEDEGVEEVDSEKNQELQSLAAWEEVRQTVEDAMEDDEVGVGVVQEAIEDALEESGLIRAKSSEDARGYVDALLAAITGIEQPKPAASSDNTLDDVIDEDAEESTNEAAEESSAEAAEEPSAEAAEESSAEAAEESTNEAAEELSAEAAEESSAEAAEESSNEAAEESTNEAAEESSAEAAEESTSEAAEEMTNEAAEESTNEATANEATEIESESSDDAQTSELGAEPDSATESTEGSKVVQESDSAASQISESTSYESSTTLVESHEAHKVVSDDSETSFSIDETAQTETKTASHSDVETQDAKQDEETTAQEEDETDEDEDEDVAESKEDESNASNMSPLKDLIVRMARKIDEKPVSGEVSEDSLNDLSKLRSFERILGEMISSAKVPPGTSDLKSNAVGGAQNNESAEATAATNTDSDDVSSSNSAQAAEDTESKNKPEEEIETGDLMGWVLTIKNKVNGRYVERPEKLTENDIWDLEYNIEEIPDARARRFYTQCKARREKALVDTGDRDSEWFKMWRGQLEEETNKGRAWRAKEDLRNQDLPVHVVGFPEPLKWTDVFGEIKTNTETAVEELKTGAEETVAAAEAEAAGEETTTAAEETSATAEETSTAAEETTTAAEETTTAAEETNAAEETSPAAEESSPAAEETTTAAEATNTTEETGTAAEETTSTEAPATTDANVENDATDKTTEAGTPSDEHEK